MKLLPATPASRWRLLALVIAFVALAWFENKPTLFLLTRIPVLYYYQCYTPQEGDVVFQSLPHGDLVDAIEGITHSPYSHCGVVLKNDKKEWVVIEAIGTVHETPLLLWEFRGRGGKFDVYRLDPKYNPQIPAFKNDLLTYLGKPYDFDYDMSKGDCAYCSGLIYSAFKSTSGEQMGTLQKLRDLDWKPFEDFIKTEQLGALPLNRVMITPASLARAPQLHEVYRSGL